MTHPLGILHPYSRLFVPDAGVPIPHTGTETVPLTAGTISHGTLTGPSLVVAMKDADDTTYVQGDTTIGTYSGSPDDVSWLQLGGCKFATVTTLSDVASFVLNVRCSSSSNDASVSVFVGGGSSGAGPAAISPGNLTIGPFTKGGGASWTAAEFAAVTSTIVMFLDIGSPDTSRIYEVSVTATGDALPPSVPWSLPDLCAAYNWPSGLTGTGVIGIVELGGGYYPADVAQFCTEYSIPVPSITNVSVGAFGNNPGVVQDFDAEVALDIQVSAAAYSIATGLPATIRMYWAPDSLSGIPAAVAQAVADGCDTISISWGANEPTWGKTAADAMEAAALAAAAAGAIVFAAAGDSDASDLPGDPTGARVDVPASCPHVVGCGGTTKTPTSETVWNSGVTYYGDPEGTGGGFSLFFPPTGWQLGSPTPPPPGSFGRTFGRMVPDVAASADPAFGYKCVLYGSDVVIGGTSACAPLYAGLFASFGTKIGFVSPQLFQHPEGFTDITVGNNNVYFALVGPDACTGLGVPNGAVLATLFHTGHPPPLLGEAIFYFGLGFTREAKFKVPEWVTALSFDAVGGGGAIFAEFDFPETYYGYLPAPDISPLGLPGRVQGILPVTPGETLTLKQIPGGAGGAGGGDGLPGVAIYRGSTLLVIAGGAGGSGGLGSEGIDWAETSGVFGAPGGGLIGGNQEAYPARAGGGTQTAGGLGCPALPGTGPVFSGGGPGQDGSALAGGAGGPGRVEVGPVPGAFTTGGGGGGGGWFGGGGGAGGGDGGFDVFFGSPPGQGGGGGSSYTAPGVGITNVVHTQGYDYPTPILAPSGAGTVPVDLVTPYVLLKMPWTIATPAVALGVTPRPPAQPGLPGPALRLSGMARGLASVRTRWLPAGDAPPPTPVGH